MANYTISRLAGMAGISVRTLHHYHDIGLLLPARVGTNGYRYYGRAQLLRLQQILIYRDLDIPLARIGAILDAPDFDRLAALEDQRKSVAQKAARSAELLRTIDRTIADIKGDRAMKDADLYSGIVDPKKQAEYETWLKAQYGPETDRVITDGKRWMADMTQAEKAAMMRELKAVEQGLAQAMQEGTPPEAQALDPLLARHHAWVSAGWGQQASAPAYAGLADMYLAHPDFIARYERIAPGFAKFLARAMKSWAARQ